MAFDTTTYERIETTRGVRKYGDKLWLRTRSSATHHEQLIHLIKQLRELQ